MALRSTLFVALAFAAGCGSSGGPLPQPGDPEPAPRAEPPLAEPYQAEPYRPEPLLSSDPLAGVPPPGRDRVLWVQTRLNQRGYSCGDPDGRSGPNTRRCVRAFRTDNGLSDEPDIDDALLALLNTPR